MNRTQQLINELFEQTKDKPRCPHIQRDNNETPYCGKGLIKDSRVSETRRMVCDTASLQLYCLNGPERHKICIYYQGELLN